MKVKRAYSLDKEVVEFLDMQKNSSKFLNHILKEYMLKMQNSVPRDKLQLFETIWGELYANLEKQIIKERMSFPDQGYIVSSELVNTLYILAKKLGCNVTEKDCRDYLQMKMVL